MQLCILATLFSLRNRQKSPQLRASHQVMRHTLTADRRAALCALPALLFAPAPSPASSQFDLSWTGPGQYLTNVVDLARDATAPPTSMDELVDALQREGRLPTPQVRAASIERVHAPWTRGVLAKLADKFPTVAHAGFGIEIRPCRAHRVVALAASRVRVRRRHRDWPGRHQRQFFKRHEC